MKRPHHSLPPASIPTGSEEIHASAATLWAIGTSGYTTVKTNMFNGIQHPAIILFDTDGNPVYRRDFTYSDYKSRMG